MEIIAQKMKTGYCNGSDMLLYVGGKAVGHCSTHSVNCASETKDRAVKPLASKGISSGLWKDKSVTGLSITVSAEGIVFYGETENGYAQLLALWHAAQPVQVKCFERGATDSTTTPEPYLAGNFVITKLDSSNPAQDDATYTIELECAGEPDTFDTTKLTTVVEA